MTQPNSRRVLITGASSGIGKATALALAKAGMDLILVGRSANRLEPVCRAAQQSGVDVQIAPIDLEQVDQVREKVGAIAAATPIDLLINNAGIGYTGDLFNLPLDDWQRVLTLNLTSVLQCIQAVLPGMRDRRSGAILNVASIAAYQAFPGWGAYNVSKAGLVSLSKTLAAEERPHGIRVMILSPGSVNTPIWDTDTVQADFDRSLMLTPEDVAQSILYAALLPPHVVVEELTITSSAGAL